MPKEVEKMMRGDLPLEVVKAEMSKRSPKMKYMKFFETKKTKSKKK